ncbi:MAG: MgtC/SapB family protein [Candidatus Aminicenantaceae bacterium]
MSLIEIALKLLLAIALGGLIGLERETREKPAGFRTNILICVGSAMMMILSGLIFQGKETEGIDLTRISAGVIAGIGFIGAGTIIQARGIVQGLTTAATLWVVAGLGLVIGAGFYWEGIIFTCLVILTLVFFRHIEEKYLKRQYFNYNLKTKIPDEILSNLNKLALNIGIKIESLRVRKEGEFSLISFAFSSSEEKEQEFNQGLFDLREILEIRID